MDNSSPASIHNSMFTITCLHSFCEKLDYFLKFVTLISPPDKLPHRHTPNATLRINNNMGYRIRNGNRVGYRVMVRIRVRLMGRLMDRVRDRDEVFWGIRSPECLF